MRDYEDNEVLPSLPPSWPSFLSVPQSLDFSAPGNALWQSSSVWGFPFANALPLQSFVCIAQVLHEATTKRPMLTTMPMQNDSLPPPFLLLQWSSISFTWKILLIYKYYISLHRVESILHIKKFFFRNTNIQFFFLSFLLVDTYRVGPLWIQPLLVFVKTVWLCVDDISGE